MQKQQKHSANDINATLLSPSEHTTPIQHQRVADRFHFHNCITGWSGIVMQLRTRYRLPAHLAATQRCCKFAPTARQQCSQRLRQCTQAQRRAVPTEQQTSQPRSNMPTASFWLHHRNGCRVQPSSSGLCWRPSCTTLSLAFSRTPTLHTRNHMQPHNHAATTTCLSATHAGLASRSRSTRGAEQWPATPRHCARPEAVHRGVKVFVWLAPDVPHAV